MDLEKIKAEIEIECKFKIQNKNKNKSRIRRILLHTHPGHPSLPPNFCLFTVRLLWRKHFIRVPVLCHHLPHLESAVQPCWKNASSAAEKWTWKTKNTRPNLNWNCLSTHVIGNSKKHGKFARALGGLCKMPKTRGRIQSLCHHSDSSACMPTWPGQRFDLSEEHTIVNQGWV